MDGVSIPLKRLDAALPMPEYAYLGDAGVDLRSTCDITLNPFERQLIPCGISLAIPQGFAGFVLPRSGLALKQGISLVNSPGLIDSNYRGEIKVIAINLDPHTPVSIVRGDRVAQLVIMATPRMVFESCEELPHTDRGIGGFGSSGISS